MIEEKTAASNVIKYIPNMDVSIFGIKKTKITAGKTEIKTENKRYCMIFLNGCLKNNLIPFNIASEIFIFSVACVIKMKCLTESSIIEIAENTIIRREKSKSVNCQ